MSSIEFIILFIIAYYLKEILDGIILSIYTGITGKELKEVKIKWSNK